MKESAQQALQREPEMLQAQGQIFDKPEFLQCGCDVASMWKARASKRLRTPSVYIFVTNF